ncbi:Mak11 protein [Starmerella bacillaris]|uniref:Mak11 protein n=1 Tax=Starmerella bacillaris TaxID=1247836 RepID=A0AAV5RGW5_STABA|nr:Mak11 protein [Starmerella bacillaris]
MLRIITGSYEHNLLCVALDVKHDVFTPIFHFTPHTQSIRCLAWGKKVLASGSNDEHIRLYDLVKRKELGTLIHHDGAILCLEFFKFKWLFSGSADGKICIWRTKDWEILAELKGHKGPVVDMTIHKSGKIMLSVAEDRRLILWNLMTARKAAVRVLPHSPRQVLFVPDTVSEYVVAYARSIDLFTSGGSVLRSWTLKSSIHKIDWYKSYLLVSCDDGSLNFFDINEKEASKDEAKKTEKISKVSNTKSLNIKEKPISEPNFILRGHAARVKDFSILNNYLASVSTDGNIVVWDLEKREQLAVYNAGDRLNCVALVPDEVEHLQKKRALPVEESEPESEPESEDERPKKRAKARKTKVTITEG